MHFKPAMSNIPLENLREEFHHVRLLLNDLQFEQALRDRRTPIATPLFTWHGYDSDLLSVLVQRAIIGVEAYTIGATWARLIIMGKMTTALNEKVRNPFSLIPKHGERGTAAAYYIHLPSLIHPDISIKEFDPDFWVKLQAFYRNVRNPLFHGCEFDSGDVQVARDSFWYIEEL